MHFILLTEIPCYLSMYCDGRWFLHTELYRDCST